MSEEQTAEKIADDRAVLAKLSGADFDKAWQQKLDTAAANARADRGRTKNETIAARAAAAADKRAADSANAGKPGPDISNLSATEKLWYA